MNISNFERLCAEREGWYFQINPASGREYEMHRCQEVFNRGLPLYEDMGDLYRVIQLLNEDEMQEYIRQLYRLCSDGGWIVGNCIDVRVYLPKMLKADVSVIKEALFQVLDGRKG